MTRDTATPPPPPQPRRGARKTPVNGSDDEGPRPSLPPRRPTDLLANDEPMGSMQGWEALKPN